MSKSEGASVPFQMYDSFFRQSNDVAKQDHRQPAVHKQEVTDKLSGAQADDSSRHREQEALVVMLCVIESLLNSRGPRCHACVTLCTCMCVGACVRKGEGGCHVTHVTMTLLCFCTLKSSFLLRFIKKTEQILEPC